jgi:hypothetical protein
VPAVRSADTQATAETVAAGIVRPAGVADRGPSSAPENRAIAGAAGAPLSNEQKRALAAAAGAAWELQVKLGLWTVADGDRDAFRHAAAFDACGVASFRAMTQRHYLIVLGYYRELSGRDGRRLLDRAATDDTRRALAALHRECQVQASAFGGVPQAEAYAAALLRRIHCAEMHSANPRQIWQVLFTLRNRARKRGVKTAGLEAGATQ